MRALLPFGWLFFAAALVGAAAETAARAAAPGGGLILSAHDVWYSLAPGGLVVAKIRLEALLGPWAWDPLATTVLALPVWLLFGGPGAALLWLGWRRRGPLDPAARQEEEALFLFDSLAEQAEREATAFAGIDGRPAVEAERETSTAADDRPPT